MGGGGAPIPQLGFSSGPAVAESSGGGGSALTGQFNFKGKGSTGLLETLLPWAIMGVALWALSRR